MPWPPGVDGVVAASLALVMLTSATVQSATGFGLSLVALPFLAFLYPQGLPEFLILVSLPMLGLITWRERAHLALPQIGWVLVGRITGIPLGLWALAAFSEGSLGYLFGGVSIVGAVMLMRRPSLRALTPSGLLMGGIGSGAMASATGVGGPPLAYVYAGQRGPDIRANVSVVFLVGNFATALGLVGIGRVSAADLAISLAGVVPTAIGTVIGGRVAHHLSPPRMRMAMVVVVALGGAAVLIRS